MICPLRDDILRYDRQVPRYTSYPTAPHFHAIEDEGIYEEWLRTLPEKATISLYLHVPFCPKLCWYCGCNTKITQRYAPVEDYAHYMLREIDILAYILPTDHNIKYIHFGGGSPGMLRAVDFDLIMEKLRDKLNIDVHPDISLELDPRNITEGRIATYSKSGVNRVSLGVQDFDPRVLSSVNREQPFYLSYDAVKLLRSYDINHINLDLLYGLPHQTTEIIEQNIDKALLLDPDRISFFGYAHVPWMKKHMRLIDETFLPQKELRFDLFETGSRILCERGYVRVGIDHFAKPVDSIAIAAREKKLHRNFQGYTTDRYDALIGLGASSIGKFPSGYVQNAVDIPGYSNAILSGKLPARKIYTCREDDRIHAEVIEQIMCYFEVDLEEIILRYNLPNDYFSTALGSLKVYKNEGFIDIHHDSIVKIKSDSLPLTRLIAAAFDEYYLASLETKRHSKAI